MTKELQSNKSATHRELFAKRTWKNITCIQFSRYPRLPNPETFLQRLALCASCWFYRRSCRNAFQITMEWRELSSLSSDYHQVYEGVHSSRNPSEKGSHTRVPAELKEIGDISWRTQQISQAPAHSRPIHHGPLDVKIWRLQKFRRETVSNWIILGPHFV